MPLCPLKLNMETSGLWTAQVNSILCFLRLPSARHVSLVLQMSAQVLATSFPAARGSVCAGAGALALLR